MNRKTASLAYPVNPLAAMRDLQELDAVPVGPNGSVESLANGSVVAKERDSEEVNATSSVSARNRGSDEVNATGSQRGNAKSSEVAFAVAPTEAKQRSSVTTRNESRKPPASSNPMADAIREMLKRPYSESSGKGSFTVSTVKIPAEIWERLDWVSTLTGQAKQEIIAEALKSHFETVLKKSSL
ncbi:MAG: hypothetical protein U0798_01195 [Gemmataceae bacterium]